MVDASVFISRPTTVNSNQELFCSGITAAVEACSLRPRTLGITDYPAKAPLGEVLELMRECQGAVVLGLRQLHVQSGTVKEGTQAHAKVLDLKLPTAWNQIEAGMAVALEIPLLIIRETGVSSGVFDVGTSDRFIHQAVMDSYWTRSPDFLDPFRRWVADVREGAV